jgi:hypothetical protein
MQLGNRTLVATVVALPPAIWLGHLLIAYALVPLSCRVGSDLPFHLASAVALAGAVGATWVAVRSWRDTGWPARESFLHPVADRAPRSDGDGQAGGRSSVTVLGVLMAGYFLLLVLMTALTTLVVDRCA